MPLYTKLGDSGQTMLYGGEKVSKAEPRIHAYGTVDELNAFLGRMLTEEAPSELRSQLLAIQHALYVAGADLATPHRSGATGAGQAPLPTKRITQEQVEELEHWIDAAEAKVPQLTSFILPGGTRLGAMLHEARTMCRRAERWLVALSKTEDINFACLRYLNRLGDFFFAAARVVNREGGVEEVKAGEEK
ncbi:MAG: cob(I)yrinic acid a,c-diamide adenosyltransferase [Patescibacteria group bacterium]